MKSAHAPQEDTTLKIAASCSLPYWLVDLWWDQICNPSRSHGGLPLSEVRPEMPKK
jgi:hypothetical protein